MKGHNWIKLLLMPLSQIYGWVTEIRNSLYDRGVFSVENTPIFTICVGNLTVGGTGKTPMIEHLIEKFSGARHVSVLSRGYGRSTRGLVFAHPGLSAADIGDEPLQFFQKYGKKVIVAVCENRVKGAAAIHHAFPDRDLLLLDDAFQHRAIGRNINILLNDYNRPFYKDHPFPSGLLRETRAGAGRADVVVVTKCPADLTTTEKEGICASIRKYCRNNMPIFFASLRYSAPVGFDGSILALKKVKVVTGIASPEPFLSFLKGKYDVIEEIVYPDHHNYTIEDLGRLFGNVKNDTFVLTTEKDMVKLRPLAEERNLSSRFAFISITMNFGSDEHAFHEWMDQKTKM